MTSTLQFDVRRSDLKCLDSGRVLALKDAAGVELTPLRGRVWLTMEGDKRDLDLRPGVPYVIERDGLTLGYALEASRVRVTDARERSGFWRDLGARVWAALVRIGEARHRGRMARGIRYL